MARQLTEPMRRVLRIMAEGYRLERFKGLGLKPDWFRWSPLHASIPEPAIIQVLREQKLIISVRGGTRKSVYRGYYALTEAGRRAAKESNANSD